MAVSPWARGRVCGNVGIFIVTVATGVAAGVVGQQAALGIDLENIQPVAAEAIEPRIGGNAGNLRMNCNYLQLVSQRGMFLCCGGKSDFDVSAICPIAQGADVVRLGSYLERALVWKVQNSGQLN